NPRVSAADRPLLSAAPLPRFRAWLSTVAPAAAAQAAVSSVEPSSTSMTAGRCCRTSRTRAAMLAPSLKQGITTAHVVGPGTYPTCVKSHRESRQKRLGWPEFPLRQATQEKV